MAGCSVLPPLLACAGFSPSPPFSPPRPTLRFIHAKHTHTHNQHTQSTQFIAQWAQEAPPFGFNGLGELVYRRTYSRMKADGHREQWFETVERVRAWTT